jgi:hypothetical protein
MLTNAHQHLHIIIAANPHTTPMSFLMLPLCHFSHFECRRPLYYSCAEVNGFAAPEEETKAAWEALCAFLAKHLK